MEITELRNKEEKAWDEYVYDSYTSTFYHQIGWRNGTVEFSSDIAKSLKFTAEHTENAKAPESLNNDWNSLKTLRTLRSPR